MAFEWPAPASAVAGAGGIAIEPWPVDGLAAVVPVRPMPVGLLVNTAVWAALWSVALLPLVSLRAVRRWRRAKRNRCVACGYARDGLPDGAPCAECGREPAERTTVGELRTARAPMLGAALALALVLASSAALPVHRWMAVDRLPPLHHAAAVGDVEAVERLIADGAVVDGPLGPLNSVRDFLKETTPLHWAASRQHAAASRALLDRGADPALDVLGYQPVVWVAATGDQAIGELLLSALQPGDELEAIEDVIPYAHPSIQRRLLDRAVTDEPERLELADCAVLHQDLPLLATLVDDGLATTGQGWNSLLRTAVTIDGMAYRRPYRNDLGLTRHVLGLGLDIHPEEARLAVESAMRSGCLPALEALLAAYPRHAGIARGLRGDELAKATMRGGAPALARLIELGADPNAPARQGSSTLHTAAMEPDADAVAILLEAGVDPTVQAGGLTLRQWLLREAEQTANNPGSDPWFPSEVDPDAFARILDLLEAAEAKWAAREREPAPPGDP